MWDLGLFLRISLTAIILCIVGDNYLNVSLWPESTALEKRYFISDTSLVHVLPSFDIIQGVSDDSLAFEEFVGVNVFRLLTDFVESS